MVYLDNAATSRFKPKCVFDALFSDLRNSANSGRSGHNDAMRAALKIESCRKYLKSALGADDGYDVIFTKNCTEALNLAIFSAVKEGSRVLTTTNEHNSVLRPLYELKRRGSIALDVLDTGGKAVDLRQVKERAAHADLIVMGGACNVTGYTVDMEELGKIARENNCILIVDGAQSVPVIDMNMSEFGVKMLACPGHKGLHGIQGTGFLIADKSIPLTPLLYGGTGTFSGSEFQPLDAPDSFEAGTLFSGGIAALEAGARWTFDNLETERKNLSNLSENALYGLKRLGCTLYSEETKVGVIAFNYKDADSTFIAEKLNEYNIAVRAGLHCAPLVHRALKTSAQGAVRISLGVETTYKDITYFLSSLEKIISKTVCGQTNSLLS